MFDIETEKLKKLYLIDLETTRSIGKMYNVSSNTIRRLLLNKGIKLRPKGNIKEKEYHFISPLKGEVKKEDIDILVSLFNDCKSIKEISKIIGVGTRAVERKINELNLQRPHSMMSRQEYDSSKDEEIIRLYYEGYSTTEIGKFLKLSHRAILNHLEHCNVKRRKLSESQFNYNKKEFPKELKDYNIVYDMYIIQRLSKKDMSETFNVSTYVIDRVLREFNIHIRNSSEVKIGLYTGSKHPNWKNGRSGLYMRLREYFRWSQIKPVIKRDGGKCQICGSSKHLQVHHIRHFKDIFEEILAEHPELDIKLNEEELYEIMRNDERLNSLDNLITYCKECHLFKVHGYKHRK